MYRFQADRRVNGAVFKKASNMIVNRLAAAEQRLKWLSTVSIVQDWQLAAMLFGLPFCLIWVFCGWLRTEPQLKYINIIFAALYVYGIVRYLVVNG